MKKKVDLAFALLAMFLLSSVATAQTQPDTLATLADGARARSVSIRTNLLWDGVAAPNLGVEFPLGNHLSLAVDGGLKPWPRWLAWDNEAENPLKWRHLAVESVLRWYPGTDRRGFVLGAGAVYSHYNIAGINAPFGLYPELAEHRFQGDFYGGNLTAGWAWWLGRHWRLSLEAGAAVGYRYATLYDCAWCGAENGSSDGATVLPKLDLSVAYHLFSDKRANK